MPTSTIVSVVNTPSDQIVTTPTATKTLTNGQLPKATSANQLVDSGVTCSPMTIDSGTGVTLITESLSAVTAGTLSATVPNLVGFNGAIGVVGATPLIVLATANLTTSFSMTLDSDEFLNCSGVLKTGGRARTLTEFTTDEAILAIDDFVVGNSASPITLTLPAATGSTQCFSIKNINSGVVTVEGAGTDTIDGSLNKTLNQWKYIDVIDYATGVWLITSLG